MTLLLKSYLFFTIFYLQYKKILYNRKINFHFLERLQHDETILYAYLSINVIFYVWIK